MNFDKIGLLTETLVAFTLGPIAASSLGLSGHSNLVSMAAIAHFLGTAANPDLGMSVCARHMGYGGENNLNRRDGNGVQHK